MDKIRSIQGFAFSLSFFWEGSEVLRVCTCHGIGEWGSAPTCIRWGHLLGLSLHSVPHGLWLFQAALTNSAPSPQPLSAMPTTRSRTMTILMGFPLDYRKLNTVRSLLASTGPAAISAWLPSQCAQKFCCTPRLPSGGKAQIFPALGTLQTNRNFLSSSPRARPTEDSRAKRPEHKHWLCHWLWDMGPTMWPSVPQFSHLQNGISDRCGEGKWTLIWNALIAMLGAW